MKNVVNVDSMDVQMFSEYKVLNDGVLEMIEDHPNLSSYEDLLCDGFGAFYKYDPQVCDEAPSGRGMAKRIIEQMMKLEEFRHLRNFTRGDEVNSISALNAVNHVLDELPSTLVDRQCEIDELEQLTKDLVKDLDANDPDAMAAFKGLQDRMQMAQAQVDAIAEAHEDHIRQALRAGLSCAEADAAATEGACRMLGCGDNDGQLVTASIKEKVQVAKLLAKYPKIKEIAKIAGRMIRIAEKKQAEKVQYERTEIEGIETGNNLDDLDSSELAKLADPDLELMFLKDYVESNLSQYRLSGKASKGKGPVVVAIDCSDSMSGPPDIWSKAITLAMYFIARKQKRAFAAVLFNTAVKDEIQISAGQDDVEGICEFLAKGVGGGTKYAPVLGRIALGMEQEDGSWSRFSGDPLISAVEFKDADVVFITDGLCRLDEDFLAKFKQAKKEMGFSLYTIWISGYSASLEGLTPEPTVLDTFSDKVISLGGDILCNENRAFDATFSI